MTLSDRHCTEEAYPELSAGLAPPPPTWNCTAVVNNLLSNTNMVYSFPVNAYSNPTASIPTNVASLALLEIIGVKTAAQGKHAADLARELLDNDLEEYVRSGIDEESANAPPQPAVPDAEQDYVISGSQSQDDGA
jgi:hypothetical protein